jgi:tyrosyl-tRNA synthetase
MEKKLSFDEDDGLRFGVEEVIGLEKLQLAFKNKQKLRVKFGIDPTSPNIHLGRSIPLWRLRAFQELGHEIHLVIGDFTGQIGDTSDKESERPRLSSETIQQNLAFYMEQFWQILNPTKKELVIIHYNSEWLSKLSLAEISQYADAFSLNQFIKRELIARRLDTGSHISLRELLYPLMQGYDSVYLKADLEIGGSDQRFNILAGRDLQAYLGQPTQAVILNTLINGTDGRKMSSSWGNVISLRDTPRDKFGKMMSIPDQLMSDYLLVIPRSLQPFNAQTLQQRLEAGENPRDLKLELAKSLVELYHGQEEAELQSLSFIEQFSKGQLPEELDEITLNLPSINIIDLLIQAQICISTSEGRRLLEQKAVHFGGVLITDWQTKVDLTAKAKEETVLRVGKRKIVLIKYQAKD